MNLFSIPVNIALNYETEKLFPDKKRVPSNNYNIHLVQFSSYLFSKNVKIRKSNN